jgi:biotin synthase
VEFKRILARALDRQELSPDEVKRFLLATGDERTLLFDAASAIRDEHFGKRAHVRAVVEFSNHCGCNCLYCGMRRDNKSLQRYWLSIEEIKQQAREARELGIGTLFLQSGEDSQYPFDDLCDAIKWITSENKQIVILCIGRRGREDYSRLWSAGATKFILKFETSNPHLFSSMKPGVTLQNRLKHLEWLREAGFKVGTGFIVGLPGQAVEDIAQDVLLLRQLKVDLASVSPFIPNDQSPLHGHPAGDIDLTLNAIAAIRIVAPTALIPSVSALKKLRPDGQAWGFKAGANVITINKTPLKYRDKYVIYNSARNLVDWESAVWAMEGAGLQRADSRE